MKEGADGLLTPSIAAGHRVVGAIVLDCTNLPPYRRALAAATRLPVFDCNTLLDWLWRATARP